MTPNEIINQITTIETIVDKLNAWGIFFAVLVAIGVGGEATIGILHRKYDNTMSFLRKELESEHQKEIAEIQATAKKAEESSSDAQKSLELEHQNTVKLQGKILNAELLLEKEKITRLGLEQELSPRIIEQTDIVEKLKDFKDIKVKMIYVSDQEARRFAGQLAMIFSQAGWKFEFSPGGNPYGEAEGVLLGYNHFSAADDPAKKACESLVNQLHANKIEASEFPAVGMSTMPRPFSTKLPPNTILVAVGYKPSRYFYDRSQEKFKDKAFGNVIIPPE